MLQVLLPLFSSGSMNVDLIDTFIIPAPVEPRNQGPPTYANLVKSGATMIPSQGSLPSAGFGKPSAVTAALSPAPSVGPGNPASGTASQQPGSIAAGNSGRDNKELPQGFSGPGSGKFRGGRQSK